MRLLETIIEAAEAIARKLAEILKAAFETVAAWLSRVPSIQVPALRTPSPAVEATGSRTWSRPLRFCLGTVAAAVLVVGGLVAYEHVYDRGVAAQRVQTEAALARAVSAEALANANAGTVGQLAKAQADLGEEVDRRARDNLASDARYAEALDAARRASEVKAPCQPPSRNADRGPAGTAPQTRSMRDALGVLRKGEGR